MIRAHYSTYYINFIFGSKNIHIHPISRLIVNHRSANLAPPNHPAQSHEHTHFWLTPPDEKSNLFNRPHPEHPEDDSQPDNTAFRKRPQYSVLEHIPADIQLSRRTPRQPYPIRRIPGPRTHTPSVFRMGIRHNGRLRYSSAVAFSWRTWPRVVLGGVGANQFVSESKRFACRQHAR